MRTLSNCIALTIALTVALPSFAADKPKPFRTGSGIMTFETVPGWGLLPSGKSALGPTHGSVVIDKAGKIYTSANKGVVVFTPDGKVVKEFLGKDYSNIHDMEIRAEGDSEFIYGARNNNAEGIKFNITDGKIVLKLRYPQESKLAPAGKSIRFNPTAITVALNGDIYLSNGYATNHIFVYDKTGKYKFHFGEKGNEMKQFNTAHGMTLDTRYGPPRLLICDRNHRPNGRLLHYDLKGKFVGEVITGLGMPTAVAIQGEYVSVPDLHGRLVILDKSNKIIATVGKNPDARAGRNYKIPLAMWKEGYFSGTHGSYWDKDGNLYVQDWNVSGRIMKLVRVKPSAKAESKSSSTRNGSGVKGIGVGAKPIAGAEVLFDGSRKMLDKKWTYWKGPRFSSSLPIKWKIVKDPVDGGTCVMTDDPVAKGGKYGTADVVTKAKYRDFRLHIEFLIPKARGNSGVYLQNRYEIQVLDGDKTKHGMGAVINETPAPYHAYNGLGKWNAYDINFRAARFKDGKRSEKAMVSMYFNGKKVHVNQTINQVWGGANSGIDGGNNRGKGITDVPGGLKLQCEGHDVRYRNIWIKTLELDKADTDF